MKAETTVNGPQTSPKMASTGTRQAARPRKRAEGEIAPWKSASGGYNDGVDGWKWEIPIKIKVSGVAYGKCQVCHLKGLFGEGRVIK